MNRPLRILLVLIGFALIALCIAIHYQEEYFAEQAAQQAQTAEKSVSQPDRGQPEQQTQTTQKSVSQPDRDQQSFQKLQELLAAVREDPQQEVWRKVWDSLPLSLKVTLLVDLYNRQANSPEFKKAMDDAFKVIEAQALQKPPDPEKKQKPLPKSVKEAFEYRSPLPKPPK